MKKITIILSLVLMSVATISLAGTIFGEVKDENGKAISGAEVVIYGKDIKTTTDAKGKFKIVDEKLLDGNRYSVKVTADGYSEGRTLSTEVFDDPEEMEALNVQMYEEEPVPEPVAAPTNAMSIIPGVVPEGMVLEVVIDAEEEELLIPTIEEKTNAPAEKIEKPVSDKK